MAAAVMAQQTVHVRNAEKRLRDVGGLLIVNVLRGTSAHYSSNQPVNRTVLETVACRSCDPLRGHAVIGLVRGERVADPSIKCVPAVWIPAHTRAWTVVGVLEQVAEKHRPLIHTLGGLQQFVDQP